MRGGGAGRGRWSGRLQLNVGLVEMLVRSLFEVDADADQEENAGDGEEDADDKS